MFAGHALAAGTATAAATSLSHPLDTLKTLIQALNPYSIRSIFHIYFQILHYQGTYINK